MYGPGRPPAGRGSVGSHFSQNNFLGLGTKQAASNIKTDRRALATASACQECALGLALVWAGFAPSSPRPHDGLGGRAHACHSRGSQRDTGCSGDLPKHAQMTGPRRTPCGWHSQDSGISEAREGSAVVELVGETHGFCPCTKVGAPVR